MKDDLIPGSKFYQGGKYPSDPEQNVQAVRAVHEVQGQIIMAKKFPRDTFQAEQRILNACKRPSLAMIAQYAYPRGKQLIKGPSIRLAEVIAQNWGNIDFGVRELSQEDGESIVESYCWDLETNTRQTKSFTVKHEIKADGKIKKLTDPRDIYELLANNGARRLRSCILGIIPRDIIESAEKTCQETLNGSSEKPMVDKIRDMLGAFYKLQVTKEMIEERLNHDVDIIDNEELSDLRAIFNSLKDGVSKRSDWFKVEKEKSSISQSLIDDISDKSKTNTASTVDKIEPESKEMIAETLPGSDMEENIKEVQSKIEIETIEILEEEKPLKSPKTNTRPTFVL